MAVNCEQILLLATALSNGSTECEWRSAVSRAYYAAYLTPRTVGEKQHVDKWLQDTTLMNVGLHEKTIFKFAFVKARPDVRTAGYGLNQLKQSRVKADYKI